MSFASLCVFTYTYPVSFLSKCHRKELQRSSCGSNILPQRSCCAFIMQPQRRSCSFQNSSSSDPQEELLADAKRSSCVCIIFGLYCKYILIEALSAAPGSPTSFPGSLIFPPGASEERPWLGLVMYPQNLGDYN